MKQTNYHLFDFMDFDPDMQKDEALWKAYAPQSVKEQDGDIVISIPYQKQKHQEDMAPDSDVPQECYDLIIRAYESNILRIYTSMVHDEMSEEDDMLQMQVKRMSLHLDGTHIIDADGKTRGVIDLRPPVLDYWSDLLPDTQPAPFITFYPDGDEDKPIALSDDHFSPPRYDALPLGFVCCDAITTDITSERKNERATISFKCEADECFAGTGERFRKMDLSGQTFQLKNQDGQGVNNRWITNKSNIFYSFLFVKSYVWSILSHKRLLQTLISRPFLTLCTIYVRQGYDRCFPHWRQESRGDSPWLSSTHRISLYATAMVLRYMDEQNDLLLC